MKNKRTRAEKQRLITQIICLALAGLMILGVIMSILPFSALTAHAADETQAAAAVQTTEEPDTEGLLLRIGLMFGSGVTESFAVRAEDGFLIHAVDEETDEALLLYETPAAYAAVTKDANLAVNDDGIYYPASKGVIIGGYHLRLPDTYTTPKALADAVDAVNAQLKTAGIYSSLIYAFPAYIDGALCVCIGDFGSSVSAQGKLSLIKTATGKSLTAVYPRDNALTVLAPDTNLILFEFCADTCQLGLSARQDTAEDAAENVIVTPAKNGYRGIFLFDHQNSGISVTNLIDLENYVAGVIPYEIGNHWDEEALKAFATIARSYTAANLGHHANLGFDLCNGSDCQVYMGTAKENDAVRKAVSDTKGQIITYNGKPCIAFYSAVTGGCTVNIEQIWNGSSYPYLRAVSTPWEDYETHPYGEWFSEVSGYELYTYLYGKGYTKLRGAIESVRVVELAENSTYVYRLELTDIYGVTVSLKGTDIIRTTLGKYLKSANFVLGHKGQIPLLNRTLALLCADGEAPLPITDNGTKKTMQVLTADGIVETDVTDGVTVIDTDGSEKLLTEKPDSYDIPEDAQARLDSGTNNFLFIGKGWGHGGGVSQWGVRRMAQLGYEWEEIIHAYFTNVEILPYTSLDAFRK